MAESRAGLGALIAGGLVALALLMLLGIGSVLAFVCFFGGGDKESEVTEAPDVQQRPAVTPRKLTPSMERHQRAQAETPPTPPAEEPRKNDANPPAKDPGPRQQEPIKDEEKPELPPPAKPQNPPLQDVKAPQPSAPDKSVVAAAFQKKIDEAIERGSKFLVTTQLPDGSWQEHGHTLGTTALPALTLLECGTSPRDPRITASADFVRKHWADNKATYEIALAILFLDKLLERKQAEKKTGAKKDELIAADKQIIQALALRLIAGQTPNGGWDYDCPILTNPQATSLLTALKQNRPKAIPTAVEKSDKSNMPTPVDKGDKGPLPAPVDKSKSGDAPGKVLPPDGMSSLDPASWPASGLGGSPPERMLHQALRLVPAAVQQPPPKGAKDMKGIKIKSDRDDNSNTQFGMMALWAARRHDIPVETAMLTVEQRFRVSQLPDGGWAYHFKEVRPKASMTCVGLIGIALGKGASAEMTMRANKNKTPAKKLPMDRMIRDGLSFLGPNLENRKVENHVWPSGLSLYFMWSVERVAVLYDLRLIEGKDWYHWGSQILLDAQRVNGSWETHSYAGANSTCDTSFALLFLKRVNLVQDLTDLQLYMAVPETQGPQPKNP